jgi:hypothetical protein
MRSPARTSERKPYAPAAPSRCQACRTGRANPRDARAEGQRAGGSQTVVDAAGGHDRRIRGHAAGHGGRRGGRQTPGRERLAQPAVHALVAQRLDLDPARAPDAADVDGAHAEAHQPADDLRREARAALLHQDAPAERVDEVPDGVVSAPEVAVGVRPRLNELHGRVQVDGQVVRLDGHDQLEHPGRPERLRLHHTDVADEDDVGCDGAHPERVRRLRRPRDDALTAHSRRRCPCLRTGWRGRG